MFLGAKKGGNGSSSCISGVLLGIGFVFFLALDVLFEKKEWFKQLHCRLWGLFLFLVWFGCFVCKKCWRFLIDLWCVSLAALP